MEWMPRFALDIWYTAWGLPGALLRDAQRVLEQDHRSAAAVQKVEEIERLERRLVELRR